MPASGNWPGGEGSAPRQRDSAAQALQRTQGIFWASAAHL